MSLFSNTGGKQNFSGGFSRMLVRSNYEFIPRSLCDDGDLLDILVFGQESSVPLCILRAKSIGVMKILDQGEADDKIIAVHMDDLSTHFENE